MPFRLMLIVIEQFVQHDKVFDSHAIIIILSVPFETEPCQTVLLSHHAVLLLSIG